MALSLEVAALTDVGCVRQNNEDYFGYDEAKRVYVVCDGMGGMAAGEVASSTATEDFLTDYRAGSESTAIDERLSHAIFAANRAVRQKARSNLAFEGMGTTLVAACVDGHRASIGNVGDSRAYLLHDGQCTQITLDHSFVAEQLRSGTISAEFAASSPFQSAITRAIGIADSVEPDLFHADLEPGDSLLLTTDGLTRYAGPEEIAKVVTNHADPRQACQALIDIAKNRGAVDNVTCLLLVASAA